LAFVTRNINVLFGKLSVGHECNHTVGANDNAQRRCRYRKVPKAESRAVVVREERGSYAPRAQPMSFLKLNGVEAGSKDQPLRIVPILAIRKSGARIAAQGTDYVLIAGPMPIAEFKRLNSERKRSVRQNAIG
jgi:hypothetical protein